MDDLYLINKVKETGDSEAFKKLAETHSGVYLNVLDRYLSEKFHTQKEDLKQDKDFNLYSAIMSYDPNKGMKFPTYLGQTIKWKCLTLKNRGNDKDTIEYEPIKATLPEPEYVPPQRKELAEEILQFAEKINDELARNVVALRFNEGERAVPFHLISEKLQVSKKEVMAAYQSFVKKARKEFVR